MSGWAHGWDPAIEPPATIGIIGAGRTGLEVALYARFLGYFVEIFEAGRIANRLSGVELQNPDASVMNVATPLGRAALEAQGDDLSPLKELAATPKNLIEAYLAPLARTDLLHDFVHIHSEVVSVSRYQSWQTRSDDLQLRANDEFRVLVHSRDRGYWQARVDLIVDCSGLSHQVHGLGPGSGLAIGEVEHRSLIQWEVPRLPSTGRPMWQGKHSVVWGDSQSAESAILRLVEMEKTEPSTKITWILPEATDADHQRAFELTASLQATGSKVQTFTSVGIDRIERLEDRWTIHLMQRDGTTAPMTSDFLLSLHHPERDFRFTRSLRVQSELDRRGLDYAHGEPNSTPASRLTAMRAVTNEPNYYVLGRKRSGESTLANSKSTQNEIRDLFAVLGDREGLDLYQNFS